MPDEIPSAENIEVKPEFEARYKQLTDYDEFMKISLCYLRKSIRVNTLKTSVSELKKSLGKNWKLEQIPWIKEGFWVEHKEGRRDIGNCKEHGLGYFYVQEAASMIPPLVLGAKPGEKILDMCAAPGSKTTQIGMYMKNKGVLIANDVTGNRLQALGVNLQRCGLSNAVITLMNGLSFRNMEFDRILVDAPCSGTGTIRKSLKTLKMWNPKMVKRLHVTQSRLLQRAIELTKKGGTIVYSTCTLEPEEDEAVISKILDKNPNVKLEKIELKGLKRSEPITEFNNVKYNPEVKKCLRIWPQDNDTEGFFVAKLKKKNVVT